MEQNPVDLVYTPAQVADYTLKEIDRRRSDKRPGIPLGLVDVDRRMNPLRPGELVTILGRPGCYKSGLAQWWARTLAEQMRHDSGYGIVAYATCEMAIEELGIYDLSKQAGLSTEPIARGQVGDDEYEALKVASAHRALLPLWFLGHSLARRRKRVRTSVFDIEESLLWIEDKMGWEEGGEKQAWQPRIIFLDYLNLMESDRRPGQAYSQEQRVRISEIVRCAKDLALTMGCPVVMMAQAHRRVDDRSWKLPGIRDGMETSSIEQFSDKILSVWMPMATDKLNDITTPEGMIKTPDEVRNTLILGLLKQKNGEAGGYTKLFVDPATNTVANWSGVW